MVSTQFSKVVLQRFRDWFENNLLCSGWFSKSGQIISLSDQKVTKVASTLWKPHLVWIYSWIGYRRTYRTAEKWMERLESERNHCWWWDTRTWSFIWNQPMDQRRWTLLFWICCIRLSNQRSCWIKTLFAINKYY